MNNKKKCFVIMPFSETDSLAEKKWTEIFEHEIKPAVEESGFRYKCERYKFRRASITKDILQELNSTLVVIADLTDNNPNVLWELGVRHTLSKRTILIAQDKKFLPSDLKDYPIITYKYKQRPAEVSKFRREIKDKLEDIEADPDKPDNPVADFLGNKNIDIMAYEKAANLRKLDALISELSFNITDIDNILTQINREKRRRGFFTIPIRLSYTCIELLCSSNYIRLPKELLNELRIVYDTVRAVNSNLELLHVTGKDMGKRLLKHLPSIKQTLTEFLKKMNKIKLDYASDNYQEPKEPCILLASPEHEEYLKLRE